MMTLEQLNEQLRNFYMKARITHRPGYGITRLAGEYEIWIENSETESNFESEYWIADMKYGWGLTLDQAIQAAIAKLKAGSIHIVQN